MSNFERKEKLNRERAALAGLHARLQSMSKSEYNALVHAIWRLDREINDLQEQEK